MNVLFLTWDGPGPNYHESLFLPIYQRLRREADLAFHLVQYAWEAEERTASVQVAARRLGIPYSPREVWRRPQLPATAAMIVRGAVDLVAYARRNRVDVLMPRSIVPAGMALLALRMLPGVRLLYDADGLMADERADFGGWSRSGRPYRALRAIERAALRRADTVITRTERAKSILVDRSGDPQAADRIYVVRNGKDADLFHPGDDAQRFRVRASLGISPYAPMLVYAGSLGPQYFPERMFAFFRGLLDIRRDAQMVVLTGTPEVAVCSAAEHGIDPSSYRIMRVASEAVPDYLSAADLGLAFRSDELSQQAVAPIKVGEYLLCGTPVLATASAGDVATQLGGRGAGRVLNNLSDESLRRFAEWFVASILPNRDVVRSKCRALGTKLFSLDAAADGYLLAFAHLAPGGSLPCRPSQEPEAAE